MLTTNVGPWTCKAFNYLDGYPFSTVELLDFYVLSHGLSHTRVARKPITEQCCEVFLRARQVPRLPLRCNGVFYAVFTLSHGTSVVNLVYLGQRDMDTNGTRRV